MKTLAFIGNCQAETLAAIYNAFVAPSSGARAHHVPDYPAADAMADGTPGDGTPGDGTPGEAALETLRAAGIVVRVLMEPAAEDPFAHLLPGREIHLVPFVNAGWLWPHHGLPHPHHDHVRANAAGMVDCSNAYLNRLVLRGLPPETAVAEYAGLVESDFSGLDRRYEILMDKQEARDRRSGFASAAFIAARFRAEPTFLTPFHPTLALSKYLALTCFERIGVAPAHRRIVETFMADSFYPKLEVPVHPAVARHFGLRFAAPGRRTQWFNAGPITFDDFIVRYMTWDTNDVLEDGLAAAAAGDAARAVGSLARGLERSPESGAGHVAMVETLLRLDRTEAALAHARTALGLVASDWRLHRLCGVCLALLGRHGEAIAPYRAAVALNQGVFQTYMDLSFSLWHARHLEEALRAVGLALEIQPHDQDALLRHDAIRADLRTAPPVIAEASADEARVHGARGDGARVDGAATPLDAAAAERPGTGWRDRVEFLQGWHAPEAALIWCGGPQSVLRLTLPPTAHGVAVEFDIAPFLHRGFCDVQRLDIRAGARLLGSAHLTERGRVAFVVPPAPAAGGPVELTLSHPDSTVPATLGPDFADQRDLALALHDVHIHPLGSGASRPSRGASHLKLAIGHRDDHEGARADLRRRFGLAADELAGRFESLGVDCEFGLLQRDCGAEPLGLLRFSTVLMAPLLRALDENFARLADPTQIVVTTDPSGEFIVSHRAYMLRYHTFLFDSQTDAAAVLKRERTRLPFLGRKLREDLADGGKCFVYKTFGACAVATFLPLLLRLRACNADNALLVVTATKQPDQIGGVAEIFPGLLAAQVDRLTVPRPGMDGRSVAAWLEVCLNARALLQAVP